MSADTTTATTDVDESTSGSTSADGVTSNAQSDTDDASSGSTGSNAAPVAGDDVFRTPMDTPLEVPYFPGVLGNDHDGEGGVASIDFVDAMSERGGVIAHRDDGGFSYTPPPGAWGSDSFEYGIVDDLGATASARVTVNLLPTVIPAQMLVAGEGGFGFGGADELDGGALVDDLGDVDGDGLGDFVAAFASTTGLLYGGALTIFGKQDGGYVAVADVVDGDGGNLVYGTVDHDVGSTVAGVGDVDGDGRGDLATSEEYYYVYPTPTIEIRGVVARGTADPEARDVGAIAAGDGGFGFTAEASGNIATDNGNNRAIACTAGVGDMNGDGLGDFAVSVRAAPGSDASRTWIVFGKQDELPVTLSTTITNADGFRIDGEGYVSPNGPRWIDAAGDVDGDGVVDVIIGTDFMSTTSGARAGRAYVVFGKADDTTVDLAAVAAGAGGFVIDGAAMYDALGASVAGIGDFDGDGLDDVLVGAPGAGQVSRGHAYVVFGKADTDPVRASDVAAGEGGFVIEGEPESRLGSVAAGGGDVDGDGLGDLLLATIYGNDPMYRGRAYVVYGDAVAASIELPTLAPERGFVIEGDVGMLLGTSAALEDVDGDGRSDVIVATFAGTRGVLMRGVSTAPY